MTFNYGITIKCIERGRLANQAETLAVFMEVLNRYNGTYVIHTFERDSMDRIHLHGHFMARKGIRLNLYKKRFWTIHIDPLKEVQDLEAWTRYITKDKTGEVYWFDRLRRGENLFRNK